MLYEITFTRSIESADGRPETEEYSQIINAPAARIDRTTGRPRFNDRMLGLDLRVRRRHEVPITSS
jgi:hypothetical protein